MGWQQRKVPTSKPGLVQIDLAIDSYRTQPAWAYFDKEGFVLQKDIICGGLFVLPLRLEASRLSAHDSDAAASASIFRSCCIYFDGRVDVGGPIDMRSMAVPCGENTTGSLRFVFLGWGRFQNQRSLQMKALVVSR